MWTGDLRWFVLTAVALHWVVYRDVYRERSSGSSVGAVNWGYSCLENNREQK